MATEMPTAEQVSQGVDLTGKTVIVTGGNVGIGKETARVLALRNAHVILACRSVEKGIQAKEEILASLGKEKESQIEILELDLSSLASVQKFSEAFKKRNGGHPSLHLLINNAGAYFQASRQTTQEGFEAHFGTNHLGPFYLTLLLLPLLQSSGSPSDPSRIVNVASAVHAFSSPALLDTDPRTLFKENYNVSEAYNFSKLCNVLFSSELNRRLAGTNVVANSLHPGLILTSLMRDGSREEYQSFLDGVSQRFNIPVFSIPQGAATTIFAAVSEEGRIGGRYFDGAKVSAPRPDAHEPANTEKLWRISQGLVDEFEARK